MPNDFINHPKTAQEAMLDYSSIMQTAEKALHARTKDEQRIAIKTIQSELESMTPVERLNETQNLMAAQRMSAHEGLTKRAKGTFGLPQLHMELDGNKNIKSLTFRSICDDADFGKTLTVSLDHIRMTEDPGTTVISRGDGSPLAVRYESNHKVLDVYTSDGTAIRRQADGSYLTTDGFGSGYQSADVTVSKDGVISSTHIDSNGTKLIETEKVTANGDKVTDDYATLKAVTRHIQTIERTEHPKEAQELTSTTVTIDGKVDHKETNKISWGGSETIESENFGALQGSSRITRNQGVVTIVPLVEGKPSGKLTYTPTNDNRGKGKLDVVFPDGQKRSYPSSVDEMQHIANSNQLTVTWKTVDGNPHHFVVNWLTVD
jgi:hypothetical protein